MRISNKLKRRTDMGEYIKCPRCDLNWIKKDQGLCDICKAELKMEGATLLVDELEDEDLVLCPVCKQNYMGPTDEMCEQCLSEKNDKGEIQENESEEGWLREYIDEPVDDAGEEINSMGEDDWDNNGLSLSQLQDDEWDEDEEEEFDDVNNPDDDFEFVDVDDEEFDEDEEEEDEEEFEDEE